MEDHLNMENKEIDLEKMITIKLLFFCPLPYQTTNDGNSQIIRETVSPQVDETCERNSKQKLRSR